MLATQTIAKFVITPKGSDITKLLLLCAPSEILDQMELSDSSALEFAVSLDLPTKRAQHERVETFALALFYATRNAVSSTKSRPLLERLYIAPEVLSHLVQIVRAEVFSEAETILGEVETGKKSDRGRRAVRARHSKPNSKHQKVVDGGKKLREMWSSGKYESRDLCTEQEYSGLGFKAFSTARKELRNTPDPSDWPAKK